MLHDAKERFIPSNLLSKVLVFPGSFEMVQILNTKRRTIQIFYSVLSGDIVVQKCIYAVPMQFACAIYLFLVCLYMKRFRVLLIVRLVR
jgi:hypothetical protein